LGGWWLPTTIFIVGYVIVVIGCVLAWREPDRDTDSSYDLRDIAQLLGLIAAACVLLFSLSNAGSIRGWTVRYVAPLYLIVPVLAAIGVRVVWRWSKVLAVACVAALVVPNLFLYGLPGSAPRAELTQQLRDDERLRELLAQHHVRMVYGSYGWVYHLNFDSLERIAGVSFEVPFDYYNYGGQLGASPVRWAALGSSEEIAAWQKRSGTHGTTTKTGDLWLFVADRLAPNAAELLAELRR
jgi:hypothetical protein